MLHGRVGDALRRQGNWRKQQRRLVSTSSEVRGRFLEYFGDQHAHTIVPSSPVISASDDQTLMFTNAGMCQFKDKFMGLEVPGMAFSRAVSAQKCIRVGGKHNDLENVGFTARHLTLFEMLGNFSFGNYFKEEAIVRGWEFCTKELGLPAERLRITVFEEDTESEELWRKVLSSVDSGNTVPIHRLGAKDNFWSMGDGKGLPCGPCSEIFFDTCGERFGGDIKTTPSTNAAEERYLEIWNLVFMQHQSDGSGGLSALPRPSVDTGMGLERICSVLQNVGSNYETDLLAPLVEVADGLLPSNSKLSFFAKRVIADHVRSCAFLIADGVVPANVGRGYVLRRLIRRSVGFAYRAGLTDGKPFLSSLLPTLEQTFLDPITGISIYPELADRRSVIVATLDAEERAFARTLNVGMSMLTNHLERHPEGVSAEMTFKLYDTFGFPLDLTMAVASGNSNNPSNPNVDVAGFERLMEKQRARSGAGVSWAQDAADTGTAADLKTWAALGVRPQFSGSSETALDIPQEARVLAVAPCANDPELQWAAISPCPFYAQGGGQVSDEGFLRFGLGVDLPIKAVAKPYDGGLALLVSSGGKLKEGDIVTAHVDRCKRKKSSTHHTATHLVHAALREVLGEHVRQAGSLVEPRRLRFDFNHSGPLTEDQIAVIEAHVNATAQGNFPVVTRDMPMKQAMETNAIMFFGEKYGDVVRVVSVIADSNDEQALDSVELCGGTHAPDTGRVFPFKIISQSAVAAGVRRVEAVAGASAHEWLEKRRRALEDVTKALKVHQNDGQGADDLSKIAEAAARLVKKDKDMTKAMTAMRAMLFERCAPTQERNDKTGRVCLHIIPRICAAGDAKETAKHLREYGEVATRRDPHALHMLVCGEQRHVALTTGDGRFDSSKIMKACFKRLEERIGFGGKGGGSAGFAMGQLEQCCPDDTLNTLLDIVIDSRVN